MGQEVDGAHFAMSAPENHGEGAGADQVLRIVLVIAKNLHLSLRLYRRAGVRGLQTTRGCIARDRRSIRGPRRRLLQNDTTSSRSPSAPEGIYISSVIVRTIVLNRGVELPLRL